jgi:2-phosphosulfolactate phosphatase
MKNKIEVCFTPNNFPLFNNEQAIVVVIDVLRATSAICTAFHHGVEKMFPVATVEEAKVHQAKGHIAAAERNGETIEGFAFGNSPFSYMGSDIKGKTVALTTTNGTQAIEVAKHSHKVVIGSFLNIDVLADWLIKQNKDVILLCAGWKNKFNMEDTMFAGAVVKKLLAFGEFITECDSAVASRYMYELAEKDLYAFLETSSHRRRLEKLKLEKDIRYCLTSNLAPVIPILQGDCLVKL